MKYSDGFIFRLLLGSFLILVGLNLFVNQMGFDLGFSIFGFWPLIFIFFGLWLLIKRRLFPAMLLLVFGTAFLLSNIFDYSIWAVGWPLIIIFIGLTILFRPTKKWKGKIEGADVNTDKVLNESAVFGNVNQRVESDDFAGGKVDAVFGEFRIDLSDAKVKNNAVLELNAILGSGLIYLPRNVKLDLESTSILGSINNRTGSVTKVDAPKLIVKANAVLGEIELKN